MKSLAYDIIAMGTDLRFNTGLQVLYTGLLINKYIDKKASKYGQNGSRLVVATGKLDEGPWVIGNIEGTDPSNVTMDVIGKRFTVGYKDVPADSISGGDRIALTFNLGLE